ncbi:hypothetical protein QBC46DRAFT_396995 [Diplogelasinospora grovesii]|uniref:Uncharacterized protein n=1 Tax=Diplogelasinospora grovesii TaxID=303347 RepID=A0AAN6MYE9_9PEZI|nr:hypothetical protein QBC46DRAFT_396995 [Diplogelasinospora grovesii]
MVQVFWVFRLCFTGAKDDDDEEDVERSTVATAELESARDRINGLESQVAQLLNRVTFMEPDSVVDQLRSQLVTQSAQMHKLRDQHPITLVGESTIRAKWTELSYKIRNTMSNYINIQRRTDGHNWLDRHEEYIASLGSKCRDPMQDGKGLHIVAEAVVWDRLRKFVLGDDKRCGEWIWAGGHSEALSKLTNDYVSSGPIAGRSPPLYRKEFHRWKAQTAAMLESMGSATALVDRVEEVTQDIVRMIGDIVYPWQLGQARRAIHGIVTDAAELDRIFCGQLSWYYCGYPCEMSYAVFDPSQMSSLNGNLGPRRTSSQMLVSLFVRPSLFKRGGETYDNYEESDLIEPCLVWVDAARNPVFGLSAS